MKVHNTLEELLRDFANHLDWKRRVSTDCLNKVLKDYVSLNSLALGKPEPLAKNKQFDNVCEYCYGWEVDELGDECNYCNGTGTM